MTACSLCSGREKCCVLSAYEISRGLRTGGWVRCCSTSRREGSCGSSSCVAVCASPTLVCDAVLALERDVACNIRLRRPCFRYVVSWEACHLHNYRSWLENLFQRAKWSSNPWSPLEPSSTRVISTSSAAAMYSACVQYPCMAPLGKVEHAGQSFCAACLPTNCRSASSALCRRHAAFLGHSRLLAAVGAMPHGS